MRKSTLVLITLVPLAGILALVAGIALGQEFQPQANSALTNDGISYQGYLNDDDGSPLIGSHDFKFALYNKPNSGDLLWQKAYNGVLVQDGLVDIILDVHTADFNGQALWLAITVDGQLLSPRKELLPVPYALSVRPGAEMVGNLNAAILSATNKGSGPGLAGFTEDDTAWTSAGVYGHSAHGDTFGVLGESEWGIGLEGRIGNAENNSTAVAGFTEGGGEGVAGYSAGGDGVGGFTDSSGAVGGRFENSGAGGVGAYAKAGDTETPDLILGGESSQGNKDDGILASDPALPGSDIVIRSNDAAVVVLDANEDEDGEFIVVKPDGETLFKVDEEGNTEVPGSLSVAGDIQTNGPLCEEHALDESAWLPFYVPSFCIDHLCTIIAETDATIGAFGPGMFWPVTYMQNSADDSWAAGPAVNIAGASVSCGQGVNGDGVDTCIVGGGSTPGGGSWSLMDDAGLLEDGNNLWMLKVETKANELSYVKLYICPLGRPVYIPPGPRP